MEVDPVVIQSGVTRDLQHQFKILPEYLVFTEETEGRGKKLRQR